jgi:hypothetical protein
LTSRIFSPFFIADEEMAAGAVQFMYSLPDEEDHGAGGGGGAAGEDHGARSHAPNMPHFARFYCSVRQQNAKLRKK